MTALDTIKQAVLGVPFDPDKMPSRTGVVKAFSEMQAQLEGAQAGALVFSTLTALNSSGAAAVNIMAWVMTGTGSGIYQNTGTASVPVWTRRGDIPQFCITGLNVGEGTVNAIQVTTDLPVPAQDGRALVIIPILGANTVSPVTVSINNGTPLRIVTNSGSNVSVGGLTAGSYVSGFISNGTFRMLSDQASAAIVAAAENAADRAEAAVANAGAGYVFPELMPGWNPSNTALAIQQAATISITSGGAVKLTAGRVYSLSQVVFPSNCVLSAAGATIALQGSLTGSNIDVTLGVNMRFDELVISTLGTETNSDLMKINRGVRGNYIEVVSASQRAGGGILIDPQNVNIGYIKTRKIDRPVHLLNSSTWLQTTSSQIGFLDVEDYVRAFRATFTEFNLGGLKTVGRSPNASKSPGHNGILIVGCANWNIGNCWIQDAGEHAIRLGGSEANPNIFPNPENVSGWTNLTNTVVASNISVAPDGTLTADRVTKAGVDGINAPGNDVTVTNVSHAFSVHVKYVSGSGWVCIRCSAPSNALWFNAQTGVLGTINSGWSNVVATDVGGGWYRVSGSITPTAGSVRWAVIPVTANGSSTADSGAADVWGVKLEIGALSSYIAKTANYSIGSVVVIRSGGCAFKVNPTLLREPGVTEKAYNGSVAGILGIDIGDPANAGNEELLRLTHVRGLKIGPCAAYKDDKLVSAQYLLQVNDVDDVEITSLGGDTVNAGFINIDGTSDIDPGTFGGDVTNLRIGRLHGTVSSNSNNAIAVNTTFNVGKVSIGLDEISGWVVNLVRWDAGTLTDVFDLHGRVTGSVSPVYLTVPNSDNFLIDVSYNNSRTMGRASGSRSGSAIYEILSGLFSVASVAPTGLFINSVRGTAGNGNIGGALEFSRIGSSRRGAAIAARQGSADDKEVDISLFIGDTNVASNESLIESARFEYSGNMRLLIAGGGIIFTSPDGNTRRKLAIDNSGNAVWTTI